MSGTMIQIRSVPEELHRQLKARAALEGMSMSDYVLREIRKSLARPMRHEILSKLKSKPVRKFRKRPADVIREGRESR